MKISKSVFLLGVLFHWFLLQSTFKVLPNCHVTVYSQGSDAHGSLKWHICFRRSPDYNRKSGGGP